MAKIKICQGWGPQPSARTNHRQTGWGLRQRGWSNDACATPQRGSCHELAWIWTDFLSKQRRATGMVETAGRAARVDGKRQPAQCLRETQDKFAIASMAKKLLHRCIGAHASACAFFAESMHALRRVLFEPYMCRCVRWTGHGCEHQRIHLRTRSLQDVHMRSCITVQFSG